MNPKLSLRPQFCPVVLEENPHQPFSLPHLMNLIQEATAATRLVEGGRESRPLSLAPGPFPGSPPSQPSLEVTAPTQSHIFRGYFSITASDPEILGPESQQRVLGIRDMVGNSGGT